jgi:hypothetical protein
MDYGKILSRSVNIVWQHKFLILLGILVALGSGSGGGGGGGGGGNGDGQPFGEPGQFPQFQEFAAEIAGLAVGLVTVLVCVGLIVAILIWVVSTVARGGLVAGVDTIESGGQSSFSHAWSAGWHKVWRLLGIGLLPSIPGLILSVVGLVAFVSYGGLFALLGEEFAAPVGMAGLGTMIAVFACFVLPIILVLSILRNFAERACMLEDLGVIDAYRRGASVLMANLGEAIILFVLQIVISIALIVIFFLPGLIAALCCFLWPLLLVVQGAVSAIVSAVWTLAWRTWTGEPAMAR